MPRLQQDTCCPETCIPDEQLVSGYIYLDGHVAGYMLLVRDTCCLLTVSLQHSHITTIHLCHGWLVSLCIQQQTGNKLATVLSPIRKTYWRQQVDTTCIRQHVSWCKRGLMTKCCAFCRYRVQIQLGNKILVYISCCLAGRAYPLGDIPWDCVARVRTDVLHCLTTLHTASGAVDEPLYPHLWTLIQFDTREFFNVLSLAFCDVGLTDVEKQGVVDILLRMMVDNSGFTQSQVMLC